MSTTICLPTSGASYSVECKEQHCNGHDLPNHPDYRLLSLVEHNMVFSSIVFLFYFLPLFFVSFYMTGANKTVLLVFSLVFYAWGEPVFLPLVVMSIVANHWLGIRIERAHADSNARIWMIIGVVANLAPLVFFKYGVFLVHGLLDLFSPVLLKVFGIAANTIKPKDISLPLGISFYTFHALSYLIDVYRKHVTAERSLRDLAVYILMFPQLIAGPIIRYKTIAGELHEPVLTVERTARGIVLFVAGLGQKVLIANTVAVSADAIFALPPDQLSTQLAWLGIVCYTIQIFFDFGGYSLMALGLGLMLGFTYPVNFNYPYVAQSMTDFWRRWHISLSAWFRDYLYVPLGGNRVSAKQTYINLWIVFLLCGLWHGAAWNFIFWGAAHGSLLVLERTSFVKLLERLPAIVRHAYVLLAVMLTWVLFRSDTMAAGLKYIGAMFGLGPKALAAPPMQLFLGVDVIIALGAGVLGAGPFGKRLLLWIGGFIRIGHLSLAQPVAIFIVLSLTALSLAGGAYNPFIYFRF